MAKKPAKKIAGKDADQYMLRLPDGLRDRVANRAAENGRSMNTEIIEAIEKHLQGLDRISELWELFQKHREKVDMIDVMLGAIDELESRVGRLDGEHWGALREHYHQEERNAQPPITADKVREIRAEIKELGFDEAKVLDHLRIKVKTVEQIKDHDLAQVRGLLHRVREEKKRNPPA
jgi:plasmid stability protein